MFGFLGNGKSSFINTCKYVWDEGEFINHTGASGDHGGHTLMRIAYPLTKTITLVDNRGCAKLNSFETGELYAQLANLLPLNDQVEWLKGSQLVEKIKQTERYVRASDFIFPVLVHSVKMSLTPEEINIFRRLLPNARDITGIFPIVVLTHKTKGNVAEQEKIFRNLGVERIFSFENYTNRDHIKTRGRHEDVLKFLLEVIKDVQFQIAQTREPERDLLLRKKMLYNLISQQTEEEQRQKLEERKLRQKMGQLRRPGGRGYDNE
ncbi:uncharacterized protein LOC134572091 [Pelobates fuscus]|uniref:uncharacterized protein LOC134572091 n=1 Tax=Pelobates fuscus TaxID=191477 RepID=UPI002FE45D14